MQVNCPVCTSALDAVGDIDFLAPSISVVKCPVCGAPISIPAGFPLPTRWKYFNVLVYKKPVVMYEDVAKNSPALNTSLAQSTNDNQGIYKDFSITKPISDIVTGAVDITTSAVNKGLSNLAAPLIIIGVFLLVALYIQRGK